MSIPFTLCLGDPPRFQRAWTSLRCTLRQILNRLGVWAGGRTLFSASAGAAPSGPYSSLLITSAFICVGRTTQLREDRDVPNG